jgi:hippurate hydrolase
MELNSKKTGGHMSFINGLRSSLLAGAVMACGLSQAAFPTSLSEK